MANKHTYTPGRNGWLNIDDPRHIEEIRRSPVRKDFLEAQLDGPTLSFPGPGGKTCQCGFVAWDWATTCSRCGASL